MCKQCGVTIGERHARVGRRQAGTPRREVEIRPSRSRLPRQVLAAWLDGMQKVGGASRNVGCLTSRSGSACQADKRGDGQTTPTVKCAKLDLLGNRKCARHLSHKFGACTPACVFAVFSLVKRRATRRCCKHKAMAPFHMLKVKGMADFMRERGE